LLLLATGASALGTALLVCKARQATGELQGAAAEPKENLRARAELNAAAKGLLLLLPGLDGEFASCKWTRDGADPTRTAATAAGGVVAVAAADAAVLTKRR